MDCSPPGSSVHGILQARLQEWVAIPFSCCILTYHKGLHAFPLWWETWTWAYKDKSFSFFSFKERKLWILLPPFLPFFSFQLQLKPWFPSLVFKKKMFKATYLTEAALMCKMLHDLNNGFLPHRHRNFLRRGNYRIIHHFKHGFREPDSGLCWVSRHVFKMTSLAFGVMGAEI